MQLACAAAAAALLACAAHVLAQGQCSSAEFGNVTVDVFSTMEQRVWPNMITLGINEPDLCSASEPVGLKVKACDADEPPLVYLLNVTRGAVVRQGALTSDAYVYITLFCSDSGDAPDDYLESDNLSSRLSDEASKSYLSSQFPSLPSSWIESSFEGETPPPQLVSTRTSDPHVTSSVETTSATSTLSESPYSDIASENPLNPVQFESRLPSSKDYLTGNPSPVNLSSRFKEPLPEQQHPRIMTMEQLFAALANSKQQFDLIMLHDNETLTSPVPGQLAATSRSPAWLTRPPKRPSAARLRQEFLPDWSSRKSLSRPRKPIWGHNMDDGAQSSPPFEEDALFWPSEGESRPVPSLIQHITNKHIRYVSPLHLDDQTMSTDWQDQVSKGSLLPKMLLLLLEQEHSPIMKNRIESKKCDDTHSVEDGEAWPNAISEHSEDRYLWQPDYSADYTADDGGSFSHSENQRPLSHMAPTYKEQSGSPGVQRRDRPPHVAPNYKEQSGSPGAQWLDRPPAIDTDSQFVSEALTQWCPECPPEITIEERKQFRPKLSRVSKETASTSQIYRRPTLEHNPPGSSRFDQNLPNVHTERPMLSSTPRHASWSQSAKSATAFMQEILSSLEKGDTTSAAHWAYLSKLLLSHPAFRDSTHIIKL